jgi:DNA-binding MarR family transcriptional regulator
MRRAWFSLNQAFRRRCAQLDLTPDQYTVLRTLLEGDPQGLTQKQLVQAMSSDANTVAALLKRMEDNGWIERTIHEKDRRAYRVRVKPSGQQRYELAWQQAQTLQGQVLSVLPESEREKFLANLELLAEACRQCAEEKNQ